MPASALYVQAEGGLLLRVLSAASSGNDVSHMVPELLQAILSKSVASSHLRKLAYDICRHANLTATDYNRLWETITSDVNSSDPEVTASALRFLVSMPASMLADRFVIGQLSELMKSCLASEAAVVRASAVQALSHVLLLPEVQNAAVSSSGLANSYEGLWDELTDSLLDERPFVVGQAAAATAQLLACAVDSSASSFSGVYDVDATASSSVGDNNGSSLVGFMMSRFADRAAIRLSTALGPVLEMCGLVPAPGQVAVCDMLLALTRRLLVQTLRIAVAGAAAPPLPKGVPTPSLGSLVTSVASYLANQLQSGDAAARSEACGAVLELSADLAEAGPVVGSAAAGLPQGLILGAADALIQLREQEFMEGGLGDICEAITAALPALLPAGRTDMLQKLWPLISRIDDISRRARILSLAWKAAITLEMDYRTGNIAQLSGGMKSSAGGMKTSAPGTGTASTAGSGPLGILADLTKPVATAAEGGGGTGPGQTTGVVTSIPASYRVAPRLRDPFVGAILSGKAPAAEASGSFSMAQASAASASVSSSPSLLSSVTSIKRAAPTPPPPLSLARVDSVRSAASGTTHDSGKGSKSEKDRKSVFSTRFFRKGKARGEADSDHASAAAAQEEAAAAAKQEEESAAAAAQQAAAPQSSPKPEPSPSGGSGPLPTGAPSGVSTGDTATVIPARPPPSHATLRHEMLQCLLQQLARHPAAAAAAELCHEHVVAVRHDRDLKTHTAAMSSASTTANSLARRLANTVHWVAMVSEVLSNSMVCVGWEPYVVPAITATPVAPLVACVPVDFNNLTADLWLGFLQRALQAARSAQALLGHMVAEAVEASLAGAGGDQKSAFMLGYGTPYGLTAGSQAATQQQPQVTAEMHYRALLSYLLAQDEELQGLLLKFLSSWSALSASVRPRVAWVAANCLTLPGHWDDRWELLVSSLDSLLVRGTDVLTASRRYDLLGSALAGAMFKAGRQAWADPNKPFLFDIASASALCEAAEYEALGLLVALSVFQHLAARLINAVADAVPQGHAGTAHCQAVVVAKRLEAVLRHFIGTETAAAPHVRDWCKRILRYLSTIMNYTPPVNLPPLVAALGVIAKQEHKADDANGANYDDDSSDASSVYQPAEGQSELPPALAAAAAAAVAAAAAGSTQHAQKQVAANGIEANDEAAPFGGTATVDEASKQRVASESSYLVHSASAAVPMWGYPFTQLSAVVLHNTKRARRHRALSQHLASATAAAEVPRPPLVAALRLLRVPEDDATIAAALPTSGPALSSRSLYRLDNETFWMALPHTHSPWQELTGPADPLLLRGCYVHSDQARREAAAITVMLSAVNRLPVDISDVEVALKTSGPVLPNVGKPSVWELPKLAAHDRATASFTFKVLGYGDIQLHIRLQLCRGPPRTDSTPLQLTCMPLEVPFSVLMRPPRLLPEAAEFFKSWGTLPARMELSGVCTWPGPEGGALLISALLRQPLGCALLQHVPAVCGFQAAFSADTAQGDNLSLVVITQLMPPTIPGTGSETFCSLSIRSSCPDLILCIQGSAATWLADVTSGTASLGGAGRSMQPAASAKPVLHPRVTALLQSYNASAAQLESALTPMVSFGLSAAAGRGLETYVQGSLNTVLLKNVAVQEWQRLQHLAV